MADTDWGGLLGTVIMGGVVVKMSESMFGDRNGRNQNKRRLKKGKRAYKRPDSGPNMFGGNNPF